MRGVLFDGKRIEVVEDLEVRDPGPGEVAPSRTTRPATIGALLARTMVRGLTHR